MGVSVNRLHAKATYVVKHAKGTKTVKRNQAKRLGKWTSIGTYQFDEGEDYVVRLKKSQGKNKTVFADAIKLVPQVNRVVSVSEATLYYAHSDHLGAVTALSHADGQVAWRGIYKPFGQVNIDDDVDGDNQRLTFNMRFPGQYYDEESGLHYNWHRYYDPELGRYIQSDPIGLDDGVNTYAYVGGNPINYFDSDGLSKRRANQGSFYQPIYNSHVQLLINQIQHFQPNFSYRTARPSRGPDSNYGRQDVVFLQGVLNNVRGSTQCSVNGNYNPTGRKGSPLNIASEYGPFSISGTPFSTHAMSRMQGRGVPPSVVLNAISNGTRSPGNRPNTTVHRYENITVITNSTTGTVVSVIAF